MTEVDYYELLDVDPTATPDEIRRAYRRASQKAHPDVGGSSGMFRLVKIAYETLSDPELRAEYDARLGRDHGRADLGEADQDAPADESADPGWGSEESWVAGEQSDADLKLAPPDTWVHQRRGLVVLVASCFVAVVLFALWLGIILYSPQTARPDIAADDLLSWYADQPVVRVLVVLAYLFVLADARSGHARNLMVLHGAFALCLVGWPVAYWDIATTAERWAFVGLALSWLMYNGLLVVITALSDARAVYRDDDDDLERGRLTPWTSWARSATGARALWSCASVTAVLYLVLAFILIVDNDRLKPDAAGSDALDVVFRYPVVVAVVVILYGAWSYLSLGVPNESWDLLHLPVALGLMIWPLPYWGPAASNERWTFVGMAFLWLLYRAALFGTSTLAYRRRPATDVPM